MENTEKRNIHSCGGSFDYSRYLHDFPNENVFTYLLKKQKKERRWLVQKSANGLTIGPTSSLPIFAMDCYNLILVRFDSKLYK